MKKVSRWDLCLFELKAIANLWVIAGMAAHYSIGQYASALHAVYEQHGAPFGRSETGLRIWITYQQATTTS